MELRCKELRCKRCGSAEQVENGFMRGKQRYRRDRRRPERRDDGKGGPRGHGPAEKARGRERHVAVGASGLPPGVVAHAAAVQDAAGVGDPRRRLKRPPRPWPRPALADGAHDRLAALLARFLLGPTLIVVRRLAGGSGAGSGSALPSRAGGWAAAGRTPGRLGRRRRPPKDHEELPEGAETTVEPATIRPMPHRLAHPNRERLPAP